MTTHLQNGFQPDEKPAGCCGHNQDHGHDEVAAAPKVQSQAGETALADLKNEILASLKEEKRAPLAWNSVTVSIVLGILTFMSIVQVVQSATLYSKLKSENLKPAATQSSGVASGLPNQVGGC